MIDKIKAFFTDVAKEMKKVSWPSRDELKEATIIVVVMCLVMAAFTYIIDIGITQAFKVVFK